MCRQSAFTMHPSGETSHHSAPLNVLQNICSHPLGAIRIHLFAVSADVSASVLLSVSGEGALSGNMEDFDYYHGVGMGGQIGADGSGGAGHGGAAVIIARVPGTPLPFQSALFYAGEMR